MRCGVLVCRTEEVHCGVLVCGVFRYGVCVCVCVWRMCVARICVVCVWRVCMCGACVCGLKCFTWHCSVCTGSQSKTSTHDSTF